MISNQFINNPHAAAVNLGNNQIQNGPPIIQDDNIPAPKKITPEEIQRMREAGPPVIQDDIPAPKKMTPEEIQRMREAGPPVMQGNGIPYIRERKDYYAN